MLTTVLSGFWTIETLARIQFAMTTIFHFFFVPMSIGLALVVAIMETLYVTKKDERYRLMAKFWGKIFLLSFAVGVVTGIIQEFQFGMNWSDYSRFVGDIFGAPLAIEALLAFFLESTFLGLWIFTWDRFKPSIHVLFIWLVTIGSMLSAFWILLANSWMQSPTGYKVEKGHAVLTKFSALLTSPQSWYEYSHVLFGAFITGGFVVAGLSAFMLFKKMQKTEVFYRKSIKIGLIVAVIGALGTFVSGDIQMRDLMHTQPVKFASMEGSYQDSGDPAAWTLVGWANEAEHRQVFGIKIPLMLSILTYHKPEGSVFGIDTALDQAVQQFGGEPDDYQLPVNTLVYSFRVMAMGGAATLGVAVLGLWLIRKGNPMLFERKWRRFGLWILGLFTFVPFIINTAGWLITELGRYPWTVYGLFKIKDSVSPNVSVASLTMTNIVYFLLFSVLAIVMIYLVRLELKHGPLHDEDLTQLERDPFDQEVFVQ